MIIGVPTIIGGKDKYKIIITADTGATITLSKSGTTYTTTEDNGTWTFEVPETGTYTITAVMGTDTATLSVVVQDTTVVIPSQTLEDNSWAVISEVSVAGTGDTYWDIGDTKQIVLDGLVGLLTLSSVTLCVYILDFNHGEYGSTDNNIIWGGFKTSGGIDVALCDSRYNLRANAGGLFSMNYYGSDNSNGWAGCDLRYYVLGSASQDPYTDGSRTTGGDSDLYTIISPRENTLMAALPADFRNVLRLRTHYTDNSGNGANTQYVFSAIVDAVSLLTVVEVFGTNKFNASYATTYQTQMAYYANGNSKVKYKHNEPTTACEWWLADPTVTWTNYFCSCGSDGTSDYGTQNYCYGLAPVFMT